MSWASSVPPGPLGRPAGLGSAILLISALLALWASASSNAAETSIGDVVASPNRFAGELVVLTGKVTKLSNKSRKGVPYHVFDLSDGTRTIPVLAPGRPACDEGTLVTVEGWVHVSGRGAQPAPRLEARRVSCP